MNLLALAAALAQAPYPAPQQPPPVGRVYTSRALHVGVRGALLISPGEAAAGFTVQVTARAL